MNGIGLVNSLGMKVFWAIQMGPESSDKCLHDKREKMTQTFRSHDNGGRGWSPVASAKHRLKPRGIRGHKQGISLQGERGLQRACGPLAVQL